MFWDSRLRQLKSSHEERLIARENLVSSLQKRTEELKSQKQSIEFSHLENELACEENLSSSLKKTEKYIERLQLDRELKEQVANKAIEKTAEKAENQIQSLALKAHDEDDIKHHQKNKEKKEALKHESQKFLETQTYYSELARKKEQEKEAILEDSAQQHSLLSDLRQEYERQKKERLRLEKCSIQIHLGSHLEHKRSLDEELRHLREEESCLLKEQEDEARSQKREEEKIRKNQKILEEREMQKKVKEEQKLYEKKREEEYVQLLAELLDEEERLEQMRGEVRRRKRLEHRLAAQRVLEERRKGRKLLMARRKEILEEERDLDNLRNSVMEEEERKLLLKYLPHLGPLLSSQVLHKLAIL